MKVREYQQALLQHMGFDKSLLDTPGVSVAGHPERAERQSNAGYAVGGHLFITCDPASEEMLVGATAGMDPTLAAWVEVATKIGGEFLGAGRQQLPTTHDFPAQQLAPGFSLTTLSRDAPADVVLLERLVEVSSEDDLDEAEIELDNLDEHMEAVLDADGQIASLASSRPFDMAPAFGDIGILTRTDCRAKGLGSAAVVALCDTLVAADIEPLYRCDEDNIGSVELSRRLLFDPVAMVSVFRFTTS